MKTYALTHAPVTELPADHVDADVGGMGKIDVPVGFRPTGVIQQANGEISVTGLATPNGVTAMHRVVLIFANGTVDVPFGMEIGRLLGNCMVPTDRGLRPAQLFEWGKWPTSTLVTGTLGNA